MGEGRVGATAPKPAARQLQPGAALERAGSRCSKGWQHRNSFSGSCDTGVTGEGTFSSCHPRAQPELGQGGVCGESIQGNICWVWSPVSYVGGTFPAWVTSTRLRSGLSASSDRGICNLGAAFAAARPRAVLPWHGLLQRKPPLGAQRVLWIQLGPEKVGGSRVVCRGQGQQEKHLLFRWLAGLKSRRSARINRSSQTQLRAFTRRQCRAAALAQFSQNCLPFLFTCLKERQMTSLFPPKKKKSPRSFLQGSCYCLFLVLTLFFAFPLPSLPPASDTKQRTTCASPNWKTQEFQSWLHRPLPWAHTGTDRRAEDRSSRGDFGFLVTALLKKKKTKLTGALHLGQAAPPTDSHPPSPRSGCLLPLWGELGVSGACYRAEVVPGKSPRLGSGWCRAPRRFTTGPWCLPVLALQEGLVASPFCGSPGSGAASSRALTHHRELREARCTPRTAARFHTPPAQLLHTPWFRAGTFTPGLRASEASALFGFCTTTQDPLLFFSRVQEGKGVRGNPKTDRQRDPERSCPILAGSGEGRPDTGALTRVLACPRGHCSAGWVLVFDPEGL